VLALLAARPAGGIGTRASTYSSRRRSVGQQRHSTRRIGTRGRGGGQSIQLAGVTNRTSHANGAFMRCS
jgi:hypothetical protein